MFRSPSPILLEIPFVPRSSRRPRRLEKTKHYPLLSSATRKPSPICVEGRVESRGDSPFFQCYSNAFSKILPKTLVLLVSFQVDKLESPFIHHIFARRAPALEVRQQIQTTRTINTTQHHQHQQPNHHRLDTALSSS